MALTAGTKSREASTSGRSSDCDRSRLGAELRGGRRRRLSLGTGPWSTDRFWVRAELDERMRLNNWSIAASYDTARIFAGLGFGSSRRDRASSEQESLMKETDVLAKAFAMPLTNPAFPPDRTGSLTASS